MFSSYSVSKNALGSIIDQAVDAANRGGQEICGLLVAHHKTLEPVRLRNKIKRGGGWAFYVGEVRRAVAAARRSDLEIVGTFHSHPLYIAKPGDSDVSGALDDSLMLVIDCMDRRCGLWHIRAGTARPVRLIRRRLTEPVQPTRPKRRAADRPR